VIPLAAKPIQGIYPLPKIELVVTDTRRVAGRTVRQKKGSCRPGGLARGTDDSFRWPRKHLAVRGRLTIALSGGQVYGICQSRSKNGNVGLLAATALFIPLGKVNFRVRGMIAELIEEVRRRWKSKGKLVKLLERFGKC